MVGRLHLQLWKWATMRVVYWNKKSTSISCVYLSKLNRLFGSDCVIILSSRLSLNRGSLQLSRTAGVSQTRLQRCGNCPDYRNYSTYRSFSLHIDSLREKNLWILLLRPPTFEGSESMGNEVPNHFQHIKFVNIGGDTRTDDQNLPVKGRRIIIGVK